MTKPVERDDLVYAIRAMREAMDRQSWDWDSIEAYLAGSLAFLGSVDEVLDILRGEARMTIAQRARGLASMGRPLRKSR